jgi:hypothetical protein
VAFVPKPTLDDRAFDADLARLRDGAAHLIDVVRTLVRRRLDAGEHPVDAVGVGLTMLEGWESVMNAAVHDSPGDYAARVQAALERLAGRVGTKAMWRWVRCPHARLNGRTPLAAIAAHQLWLVESLIDQSGDDALRGPSREE